jgi:hypothetical protein
MSVSISDRRSFLRIPLCKIGIRKKRICSRSVGPRMSQDQISRITSLPRNELTSTRRIVTNACAVGASSSLSALSAAVGRDLGRQNSSTSNGDSLCPSTSKAVSDWILTLASANSIKDGSAWAFYFGATDYTAPGTLTIPGPDTRSLIDQGYSTPELGYQDTFINGAASLMDAQAVYQTGTYAFDLPAGAQPDASFSINYTGNAFPNVPLVTNLSTLQSLNAADSVTFDLNGMTASPNATLSSFSLCTNRPPMRWSTLVARCQTPRLILSFPEEFWLLVRAIISTCFTPTGS